MATSKLLILTENLMNVPILALNDGTSILLPHIDAYK